MSLQHFATARELGMETVGFLMLAHRATPEVLAQQARIMVNAGAQCVYVVDSAGALVLEAAQERISAVLNEVGEQAQVCFHGHQNLSMGVANSVLAYRAGAKQIDGALCALGAGAGNSPTEVLAATFERMGIRTGVDLGEVLSAAEEVVRPFIARLPWMDRASITQGYAGVYSSFLLHAERAAERYGYLRTRSCNGSAKWGMWWTRRHDHRHRVAVAAGTRARRPGRDWSPVMADEASGGWDVESVARELLACEEFRDRSPPPLHHIPPRYTPVQLSDSCGPEAPDCTRRDYALS